MLYDLIIIGADAAGLTAAIYAGRKKIKAVVLTDKLGGQSFYTDSIENYPGFLKVSGLELISKIKSQVEKFGVEIKEGERAAGIDKISSGLFLVKTEKSQYEARSIIIATGSHWKKLNVAGEEEFMGKGVSICAICDAPFFDKKVVAVVGGGNSAFESAYDLLKYASKIYILQHSSKFTGDKLIFEELKKSGRVEFLTNAETTQIKGDKFVNALVYKDKKSGEEKELEADGVFINIGREPNSSFVESFLNLNERKEIIINPRTCAVSVKGVFAAGDVTDIKYKQFVIAAAEGAKAVLSVSEYLKS